MLAPPSAFTWLATKGGIAILFSVLQRRPRRFCPDLVWVSKRESLSSRAISIHGLKSNPPCLTSKNRLSRNVSHSLLSHGKQRKNWDFVRVPPTAVDEEGTKVLDCPQDPSMIKKTFSFLAVIDPTSILLGLVMVVVGPPMRSSVALTMVLLQNLMIAISMPVQKIKETSRCLGAFQEQKTKEVIRAGHLVQRCPGKEQILEDEEHALLLDLEKQFPGLQRSCIRKSFKY